MGHDDVASGYPISTNFCRLTGCQRNPQDRGVTVFVLITTLLKEYIFECEFG